MVKDKKEHTHKNSFIVVVFRIGCRFYICTYLREDLDYTDDILASNARKQFVFRADRMLSRNILLQVHAPYPIKLSAIILFIIIKDINTKTKE